MFKALRRFLRTAPPTPAAPPATADSLANVRPPAPEVASGSNAYFATMAKLREAISKRDYGSAAELIRENLRQIPAFVKGQRREFSSFDITSIPALEEGGTILALVGDKSGLDEMVRLVQSTKELQPWKEIVDSHAEDHRLFKYIVEVITENPNCLQTDMASMIGVEDKGHVATLLSWLEKAGKITKTRKGRTNALAIAGSADAPKPLPKRDVKSHRTDRSSPKLHEIEIGTLPYVPLPRSPDRWEGTRAGKFTNLPEANDFFEVHDSDGWQLASIEKVPVSQRPDPSFREMHAAQAGIFMIDDLGKAIGFERVGAAAIRYDRAGNFVVKAPLEHSIYRLGVNPLGHGFVAMSKDCVLHAYGDDLHLILETSLRDAPEIRAIQRRLGIGSDELKNHIRCVALSHDANRYLFTAVDEAWCIDSCGKGLWGARLPIKDGWSRVSAPSDLFATSAEVDSALKIMGLSLPVTPEDVKGRYRELAKKWHPDLNPGLPEAEERMKALNQAAEALTGISTSAFSHGAGALFAQEVSRTELEPGGLTFTVSMQVSEVHAADWIYAAAFAGRSNSAFLAGYSGRVVVVNEHGTPLRAYDIGAVPRRIADTGDYLYILTDTRLYVLQGESLYAVIDTSEAGDLIVAQTGFGLIEKKRFRWFREDGGYLGSVITKEPIRRVYSTPDGMVVESRQRRATIHGVPTWWE